MSQRQRFDNRVCLVAGGGRGIGQALAIGLGAEGGRVAVAARTASQCEETATEIREAGGEAIAVELDVTAIESCERAVAEVTAALGPPDILVNSAGISDHRARIEKHEPDAWDRIVDVNLSGTFRVTRACGPALFETRGAVLNISSATAFFSLEHLTAYGATKAGIIHFTRTVAREWAGRGVRVNALCPGYVMTDLTRAFLETERLRDEVLDRVAMGRLPELDEITAPGLFLLSDEASYMTGTWLVVDGGLAA